MEPPNNVDLEKADILPENFAAYLSNPPRSGELSPYACKVAAEFFIWLASIIVFGSTIDFVNRAGLPSCTPLCRFGIATAVVSFIISTSILMGQCLAWTGRVERTGWFSEPSEKKSLVFLAMWWTIGAAFLSALEPSPFDSRVPVPHSSGIGILFAWLALFASIFGAYKAYHTEKENQRNLHYAQVMSIQAAEDEEFAQFS